LKWTMIIIVFLLLIWIIIAPHFMDFRISDAVAIDSFKAKGVALQFRDLSINNHHIHYAVTGNDSLPTLVFIHGSPSSWNAFMRYMMDPDLLARFRMISIDRPGFGKSNFGDAVNLAEQSSLMMPVLKENKNGKPFYLAGHSLGGPAVIKMAADDPEDIAGIMLIAGSIDPALEPKEPWRKIIEKFPLNYLIPGALRPSNTELLHFKKDVIELANDFPKIKIPVCFIHGEKDVWVPPGNVDYGKKMLTNASKIEIKMLPGANHFIPWNRYDDIKAELLKMLQ